MVRLHTERFQQFVAPSFERRTLCCVGSEGFKGHKLHLLTGEGGRGLKQLICLLPQHTEGHISCCAGPPSSCGGHRALVFVVLQGPPGETEVGTSKKLSFFVLEFGRR